MAWWSRCFGWGRTASTSGAVRGRSVSSRPTRRAFLGVLLGAPVAASIIPTLPVPKVPLVHWHPAQTAFFAAGRGAGKSTTFMLMHRSTAAAYRKLLEADRRYGAAETGTTFRERIVTYGDVERSL
jgi:hypothetical protein